MQKKRDDFIVALENMKSGVDEKLERSQLTLLPNSAPIDEIVSIHIRP